MKILGALIEGNLMKVPAQSVDIIAGMIMKSVVLKAGLDTIPGVSLPAHVLFNYFTHNSAKVSTYAKTEFDPHKLLP